MMYRAEILENVKMLLGIDSTEKDSLLNFLIDDTVSAVLSYCRIEFLPETLTGIVAQMVAKSYNVNCSGDGDKADIASISQGDRSVSYRGGSSASLLVDFEKRLEPFVNRKGKLPSEVSADVEYI